MKIYLSSLTTQITMFSGSHIGGHQLATYLQLKKYFKNHQIIILNDKNLSISNFNKNDIVFIIESPYENETKSLNFHGGQSIYQEELIKKILKHGSIHINSENNLKYKDFFKKYDSQLLINKIDLSEKFNKLLYGDSHVYTIMQKNEYIHRNNGLTLHNFNKTFYDKNLLRYFKQFETVKLMLGNVDIQHHFSRYENSLENEILNFEKIIQLCLKNSIKIELAEPIMIVADSYKISKVFYHNGEKFSCEYAERVNLRNLLLNKLKELCKKYSLILHKQNQEAINKVGELSTFALSGRGDIHLRPAYYAYINDFLDIIQLPLRKASSYRINDIWPYSRDKTDNLVNITRNI